MTDVLDRWLAEGRISPAQHQVLGALVRRERLSVFVELNALLYIGVLALAGGIAWTARAYSDRWGDAAILVPATSLVAGAFIYCFMRVPPFSVDRVPAPGLVFDYVLYLGCLVFAVELGYIEYRFKLLQDSWDTYLLASAIVYFMLAYRFDNRFVLSLAIATLGGWFGVRLSRVELAFAEPLRTAALAYGVLVAAVGLATWRAGIKRHFLDSYLHVAVNVVLAALLTGTVADRGASLWVLGLLLAAGAAVAGGVHFRRFAFVVYGVGYAYVGISREVLRGVSDFTGVLLYVVVSASLVVLGLVALSRRFGREE